MSAIITYKAKQFSLSVYQADLIVVTLNNKSILTKLDLDEYYQLLSLACSENKRLSPAAICIDGRLCTSVSSEAYQLAIAKANLYRSIALVVEHAETAKHLNIAFCSREMEYPVRAFNQIDKALLYLKKLPASA